METSTIDKIKTAKRLLDYLENHDLLSYVDLLYLSVVLVYIHREDLQKIVDIYARGIQNVDLNPLHLSKFKLCRKCINECCNSKYNS